MAKRHKEVDETESVPKHQPDDYAIYPHRDNITADAMPFKLADYGDEGALTEDQIRTISARHRLSMGQVHELSRLVGYSLDVDTKISHVTISRATVESRTPQGTSEAVNQTASRARSGADVHQPTASDHIPR